MAIELDGVASWIYATLSSNTVVMDFVGTNPKKNVPNIYEGLAPQDATYPLVLISMMPTGNQYRQGQQGKKIFLKSFWIVRVVDESQSFSLSAPIVAEIDRLLHKDQLDSDDVVAGCRVLEPIQFVDTSSGVRRNHYGSRYEVMSYGTGN